MSRRPSCRPGRCAADRGHHRPTIKLGQEEGDSSTARSALLTGHLVPAAGQLLVGLSLSYGLCRYLPPSVPLVLVVPLVQVSLKRLIGRMQSVLTSLLSQLGVNSSSSSSSTPLPGGEYGCAGLLRELVLSQQKTMFYTVTVSPAPTSRDITTRLAPNLKWQCACALSRSQSVIKRTNNNSTRYYTITYMGEFDTDIHSSSQESLAGSQEKEKDYSPVKIYIKS